MTDPKDQQQTEARSLSDELTALITSEIASKLHSGFDDVLEVTVSAGLKDKPYAEICQAYVTTESGEEFEASFEIHIKELSFEPAGNYDEDLGEDDE
jgi:hypothetical protein